MKKPIRLERVTRTDHGVVSTYMWRLALGRLNVHLFFRGDGDEDPHDHPWDYWTFPLSDYIEQVYDPDSGYRRLQRVEAWRWHHRNATHIHRVLGRYRSGMVRSQWGLPGKFITLVLKSKKRREWGFWTDKGWVAWAKYVVGERN